MTSIFLPDESETNLTIQTKDASFEVDMFELDLMFYEANESSKEEGVRWDEVFQRKFEKKFSTKLTKAQIYLLHSGLATKIKELKKKHLGI